MLSWGGRRLTKGPNPRKKTTVCCDLLFMVGRDLFIPITENLITVKISHCDRCNNTLIRRSENTGLIHSISTQKNKWLAGSCRQVLYCAASYQGRQLVVLPSWLYYGNIVSA